MAARARSLRPRGSDDLGLRRALSDRLLPLLVAAMTFLAALTCAGAIAAADLTAQWRHGAAALVTVQVPRPEEPAGDRAGTRGDAVAALLDAVPGLSARRLGAREVGDLVRPWLGDDTTRLSLLLPAVFEVRAASVPTGLRDRLDRAADGTLVEQNQLWFDRLAALAGSLRTVAGLALAVVAFVAASVVAIAARAGLAARRDAIEIVHGLGGTDGMIAGRFAGRVTLLAFAGSLLGAALAVPVLLGLANLTLPFQPVPTASPGPVPALPRLLWAILPGMTVLAAAIGWATTQLTVRAWLARLP